MQIKVINNPKDFLGMTGILLGVSEWKIVTQKEINAFASATQDYQWIHVNEAKAKKDSPFKTTIAHGYYSLSLIPKFVSEIWKCKNLKIILNYGTEKIRFISPVKCNDSVRASIFIKDAKEYKNGILVNSQVTVEIKKNQKPALIAETLSLLY